MLSSFASNIPFPRDVVPQMAGARFTVANKTTVSLTSGVNTYHSDVDVTTDFTYTGKKVKLVTTTGNCDVLGLNKQFIDANGIYDQRLAAEEFAKRSLEKRFMKEDTMALLAGQPQGDCQHAFLYNMLISWGKAALYSMDTGKFMQPGGHPDDPAVPAFYASRVNYSDSHFTIDLHEVQAANATVLLQPPVRRAALGGAAWTYRGRTIDNYFDRPFVLRYNAADPSAEKFYLWHVLGRDHTSALNFDVQLDGLRSTHLYLDPINRIREEPANMDGVDWTAADVIWSWITDYVSLNRLTQTFAAVFETFCMLGPQPMWTSQEACAWQQAIPVLSLGEFTPTRARFRTALEGEPFVADPEAVAFTLDSQRSPKAFLHEAAVTNYYYWFGLYALLHNDARSRYSWRTTFNSYTDELAVLFTPDAKAACISAVTGHAAVSFMCPAAYAYFDPTPVGTVGAITGVTRKREGAGLPLPTFNALYAPVSGSLLIGTFAGELGALQHLKGVQEFKGAGIVGQAYGDRDLVVVSNAYRLLGHDVVLSDRSKGLVRPWASAHQCVIEPASISFDPAQPTLYCFYDAERREGRSATCPDIAQVCVSGMTFVIARPNLRIVEWQRRRATVLPYLGSLTSKAKVEFKVRNVHSTRFTTFEALPVAPARTQPSVFHKAESLVPPTRPAGLDVVPAEPLSQAAAHMATGTQPVSTADTNTVQLG